MRRKQLALITFLLFVVVITGYILLQNPNITESSVNSITSESTFAIRKIKKLNKIII